MPKNYNDMVAALGGSPEPVSRFMPGPETEQALYDANVDPGYGMNWLQRASLPLSAFPVAGDVAGLAGDAQMYYENPESRNWMNYVLSAAGALPFVPSVAGAVKNRAAGLSERPTLEQFTRSQRASKSIKHGSSAQALRREIKAKRDARRDLTYSNQDSLGRVGIDQRLQWHKDAKQRVAAAEEIENRIEATGGLWNARFENEIREASKYSPEGWEVMGAVTRANMEAVPRQLKKLGWSMRHSSAGRGGRKSSRYITSPDGKYEVRLSDHHLPDTPQRADTIARGGHRWTDEIVLRGDESPNELIDAIQRARASGGERSADDVLRGLD